MKDKIKIFDFNHINNALNKPQIEELKAYYKTYHLNAYGHKKACKKYKRLRYIGDYQFYLAAQELFLL